jgi:hypothetical protein
MKINGILDTKLSDMLKKHSKFKTEKSTVEGENCLPMKVKEQEDIRQFRGKLHWEGDLEKMRKN